MIMSFDQERIPQGEEFGANDDVFTAESIPAANEDSFTSTEQLVDVTEGEIPASGIQPSDVIEFTPTPLEQSGDTLDFNPNTDYLAEMKNRVRGADVIEWTEVTSTTQEEKMPAPEKQITAERVTTPEEQEAIEAALKEASEHMRNDIAAEQEERLKEIASTNPEKGASLLERWQAVGQWYNARPIKQKIALSVGLAAAGVGAAAVGAAGAGLAIGGLMVAKRFVGAAGTYAMLEAGLARAYAKKEKERSSLHKKIDSAGAATLAVLIGGGAITTGIHNILEHGGNEMIDAAKEKIAGVSRWAKETPRMRQIFGGGSTLESVDKHLHPSGSASHHIAHEAPAAVPHIPETPAHIEQPAPEPVSPVAAETPEIKTETPHVEIADQHAPVAAIEQHVAPPDVVGAPPHNLPTEHAAQHDGEAPARHPWQERAQQHNTWRERHDGMTHEGTYTHTSGGAHETIPHTPEEVVENELAKNPSRYVLVDEGITPEDVTHQEVDQFLARHGIPINRLSPKDYQALQTNVLKEFSKHPAAFTLETEAKVPGINMDIKTLQAGTHIDRGAMEKLIYTEAKRISRIEGITKSVTTAVVVGILGKLISH